ncbi:MAG: DUF2235 domain-containing protein [Pseudomonadota bacterium]
MAADSVSFSIAPIAEAPIAGITFAEPAFCLNASKCEIVVNIGLFFDGTRNNKDQDSPKLGHSNIARLHDAYIDDPDGHYFRVYMPGVGTQFPQIGEYGEHTSGSAFAIGAEARVLYGLLRFFNAIHRSAFGVGLFNVAQIKALCGYSAPTTAEQLELEKLGLGLSLAAGTNGHNLREHFLKEQANQLEKKLRTRETPKIKECFIDVFGFSRGAAEARVFCQWFVQLLSAGEFAGIPVRFRFLGLIDTVASAGYWDGISGTITNTTDGHTGWAAPENLRIHPMVENCLHMVAMHELRKNFPLDEVRLNGVLPSNCQEFAYPGAHSDIGGGYLPEELGVSVGKSLQESDALKLAQIPLNHMLACAMAAGAPMDAERARQLNGYDAFAIAPPVKQAFQDFLALATLRPRKLCDWMQPYLNWRWQVRNSYLRLNHIQRAKNDRQLLLDGNSQLMHHAEIMRYRGSVEKAKEFLTRTFDRKSFDLKNPEYRQEELSSLDPEALAVLQLAQDAPPISPGLAAFFDDFVHDSLAGFRRDLVEQTGYWRYRRGFQGSAVVLIATDQPSEKNPST